MGDTILFHDSHRREFRQPFGAVACNRPVCLRLSVRSLKPPATVMLRLWQEGVGETCLTMTQQAVRDTERVYEAMLTTPLKPALLWYYFIVDWIDSRLYYGNQPDGLGGVGHISNNEPQSFQITIYREDADMPAWFKDAVVYQIFIDRFFRDNEVCVSNAKPGSLLHAYWDEIPFYTRDVDTKHVVAYDFFGGNLAGVMKKLPYLQQLGISAIYFNPLFDAVSNHRYDTGDYKQIDTMIGDNEQFRMFCTAAKVCGIRVILDGVFSHTGSDSIYFNKEARYPGIGAYQSPVSPYYKWYRFRDFPADYDCWWGITSLPNVNELESSYLDYIIRQNDSVIKYWIKLGASGWRLDVADELPTEFISLLRRHLKSAQPEAVLIGEVWEDASHKISYGETRTYLGGEELDSVMNYPFRQIALEYLLEKKTAADTARSLYSLYENYPPVYFRANLNLISSHDVPRILTLLGEAPDAAGMTTTEQALYRLAADKRALAVKRLKLLVIWQMTFPGVPCIYYGDEAGVEGYGDPFNRAPYPWGREDVELVDWYKKLISLRQHYEIFRSGDWQPLTLPDDAFGYMRCNCEQGISEKTTGNHAIVLINRSTSQPVSLTVAVDDWPCQGAVDILNGGVELPIEAGQLSLRLEPLSGQVLLSTVVTKLERGCGVLLHITSLPSYWGIGDFGPGAYQFIDFLRQAGQRYWQILPLGPVGFGESPYQTLSAFAGNHLLISPERLVDRGWLQPQALAVRPDFSASKVDYDKVRQHKERLLRVAFQQFALQGENEAYRSYLADNGYWLKDYALFMAMKNYYGSKPWYEWAQAAAGRNAAMLDYYTMSLRREIEYHYFCQYVFDEQWAELKRYANSQGIAIIGDLPLFVAHDSSDVWSRRQYFALDANGYPTKVAGVPPDYFSTNGQLWGNPHYDWDTLAHDSYRWWVERIRQQLRQTDLIRLDHFRGFAGYWEIPAGQQTAANGRWVAGPGAGLWRTLVEQLGDIPAIAEDLGIITPDVVTLKEQFEFPGMQVLQFALLAPDEEYLPIKSYPRNSVVYTGTHDNDTTAGWYQDLSEKNPLMAQQVWQRLGLVTSADGAQVAWKCIELAYQSNASVAIIPLQDILGLDSNARTNMPGTVGGNWQWRCPTEYLTEPLAERLSALVAQYKR